MEDPEAYLRALTAPLAQARDGEPRPVVRFSAEAVANAFVILGLLPRDVPGRSSPRSRRRCKRSACR
jgi:hypothetical protein